MLALPAGRAAPEGRSAGPRKVGLLLEEGPAAGRTRATLEQALLASSLFAPVRAAVLERRPAPDPLRALLAEAESVARSARFARKLALCIWSTSGAAALRHGPALRFAAWLAETPLVVHLRDDGLARALDDAPSWRRELARHSLFRAPLLLVPTRDERRRLADLPGARWFPSLLDELEPPPERPTFARLLVEVEDLAQCARVAVASPAPGPAGTAGGRARVSLLCPPEVLARPLELPLGLERRTARGGAELERALLEHGAVASLARGPETERLLLRAARAGRALLAPATPALSDLLAHERDGLVLEGSPEEALARAWARLATDGALLARLGAAARERSAAFAAGPWHARLEDWLFQLCDQLVLSPTYPSWETLPGERPAPALRQSA